MNVTRKRARGTTHRRGVGARSVVICVDTLRSRLDPTADRKTQSRTRRTGRGSADP
jgi:hypothetical protein